MNQAGPDHTLLISLTSTNMYSYNVLVIYKQQKQQQLLGLQKYCAQLYFTAETFVSQQTVAVAERNDSVYCVCWGALVRVTMGNHLNALNCVT